MKDNIRENARRYRERHPERTRAASLKWYYANKEKIKEKRQKWQRDNPEKSRAAALKWHRAHPEKSRAIKQAYRAANRDRIKVMKRGYDLKTYGLTPEDYQALLAAQDGKCAICQRAPKGSFPTHMLAVDHCHDSKKVRGLLCNSCNNGLGRFRDNPQLLRAAANYLET